MASRRGLILYAVDAAGSPVKVLADPDGTLRVDGTVSLSSAIDVSDREGRLLGIIYGSQGQQLKQTPTNYNLQVELATGATLYDARQIRALTSADVVSAAQSGAWSVGVNNFPTDYFKAGQNIGNTGFNASNLLNPHPVSLASIPNPSNLDVALSTRLKISDYALTQELGKIGIILTPGGAIIDPRSTRALTSSDIITAYGSIQALLQRASTYDLIVQLRSGGAEIDPRVIRALTSSDIVTAVQATRTSLLMKPEREDLTSQGGLYSPNAAGVQVIAPSGSTTIKVFKAGYHSANLGLHYFYFGTTTTPPALPSAKVFLMSNAAGHYRQTNTQPDVSGAGDGLYICSATAESNMPVDVQYAQE